MKSRPQPHDPALHEILRLSASDQRELLGQMFSPQGRKRRATDHPDVRALHAAARTLQAIDGGIYVRTLLRAADHYLKRAGAR